MNSIFTFFNWKLVSAVSVVLLGGTCFLSWQNREIIRQKTAELSKQEAIVKTRQVQLDDTAQKVDELKVAVRKLDDEIETLRTDEVDVGHRVVAAKSDLNSLDAEIASAQSKLKEASSIDFDEVSKILDDIESCKYKIESAHIELVKLEGTKARIDIQNKSLTDSTLKLQELRKNQDAGIITGSFRAPVVSAFNNYSFVVIGAGNQQGVVLNAQLDIENDGVPVAKLVVTEVGPELCVADIVPGSVAPGRRIQVGDWVSQSKN